MYGIDKSSPLVTCITKLPDRGILRGISSPANSMRVTTIVSPDKTVFILAGETNDI